MIVYKVVSKSFGRFASAVMLSKGAILEYAIGVETKPIFGEIFVFKTLKEAKTFRPGYTILKCNAPSMKKMEYIDDWEDDTDGLINWWKLSKHTKENSIGSGIHDYYTVPSLTPIGLAKGQK